MKNLPGKILWSVSEPGARDTKFQFSMSIHFLKTFSERGAEPPDLRLPA
jgi:hypothetical protein